MSRNDYRSIFISEGREHIAEIFSDLSKIERTGKVEENLLFDMFRRFHTLKGMANAMEQRDLGRIAHLLEEMLEYIRGDPQTILSFREFIRKGINCISDEIDNYEKAVPFSSFEMVKELEYITGEIKKRLAGTSSRGVTLQRPVRDLSGTFEIVFQILPISRSPSVRAFMLLREISRFGPVATSPSVGDLKSGLKPDFVKVYLMTEPKEDELSEIVLRVSEISLHSKGWYREEIERRKASARYIRVPFERVEEVTGALDELFLLWNKYRHSLSHSDIDPLVNRIEYGFRKILNFAGRMRTVPVSTIVPKLTALVDGTARSLGKKVRLEICNEEIEIDKSIIDRLEEPMMHIIRNSIYHGIEEPSVRRSLGKSEDGNISIIFGEREEYIEIQIRDDGRGLDREGILNSAIERGIINPRNAEIMRDEDVYELIFIPGLSTLRSADMTSGRGFGMDIVRDVLWQIGGDVVVSSRKNIGLEVSLKIPYQFASKKVIVASASGFRYAFPLLDVEAVCNTDSIAYSEDRSSIIKEGRRYTLLNNRGVNPRMFLLCSPGDFGMAIGVDDILFIGETRLYKVPYLLKSSKFINGVIVVDGMCPVPVISVYHLISERSL